MMKLRRAGGFTLVELLVVMGIMVLLIAIVGPTAIQMLRGTNITQSGEMVSDQFVLARQTALTKNRPVEVRFYEVPIASADKSKNFAAMQSFRIEENGVATPVTKLQLLRDRIVFATDAEGTGDDQLHSTLINPPQNASLRIKGTEKLPVFPNEAECKYVGFQFLPNGSADLDPTGASEAGGWFVTLVEANLKMPSNGRPKNFYTLRIEPLSGRVRFFRP